MNDDTLIIEFEGKEYSITPYGFDVSDEFDEPEGTIIIEYKIKGFEIDLYTVFNYGNNEFSFTHKVYEDGKDYGLFVSLQDEALFEKAINLMANIEAQL